MFRVDASPSIGLGHLMRCLCLASLLKKDAQITFVCHELPINLVNKINHLGFTLTTIGSISHEVFDEQEHALACLRAMPTDIDLLVIDHYQLGATFSKVMRQQVNRIMVIDDLANRIHDCDLLLDQNLFVNFESRYNTLVPAHCTKLLGPRYALLRNEFYQSKCTRKTNHLLVNFGGSDADNLTDRLVNIISELKIPNLTADIVVGLGYQASKNLKSKVSRFANMQLHVNCDYMAMLMQRASLMIGSGGSTHWERCASGLTGLVITTATNQIETTRCLSQQQCCEWIGHVDEVSDSQIAHTLYRYLSHPEKWRDMGERAKQLVPDAAQKKRVRNIILAHVRGNNVNN